jgi:uncharacterized protein (DUF433 family)
MAAYLIRSAGRGGLGYDRGMREDAFLGIETSLEICGGEPRVADTRIPVWLLVRARGLGMSEAALLKAYPFLRAEDLTNAWAYYRDHCEEIDRQIRDNEAE